MCGILGYIGRENCVNNLIEGIQKLEYRGYDSAGIGIQTPELKIYKQLGSAKNLLEKVTEQSTIGLAHTRWATHGEVNLVNCHPHLSKNKNIAIVHNGILENYAEVKQFLSSHGYTFTTDTDTEVIANLVEFYYDWDLLKAVLLSVSHLKGSNTFVVMSNRVQELVGVRVGDVTSSPLYLGLNDQNNSGYYIGSDTVAFSKWCNKFITINNREIIQIKCGSYSFLPTYFSLHGTNDHSLQDIVVNDAYDLIGYSKYMQKEIFEQPFSLKNTIDNFKVPKIVQQYNKFIIIGCGSAYYAGLAIKNELEEYGVSVSVEYSHEFRYSNKRIPHDTCIIAISQSGETSDTLHGVIVGKTKNLDKVHRHVVSIVNTIGSSIAKESDTVVYLNCGSEVGVAATKSFISQLYVGYQLLGRNRDLDTLPEVISNALDIFPQISSLANKYKDYKNMLVLGKQKLYPIALEGALKIKEISYIHAEAFPMSELKHGSIALVNKETPSIFLVQPGELLSKTISSMREVKSRGGTVIAITTDDAQIESNSYDDITRVNCSSALTEFAYTVVLQLFAYYLGTIKGYDVDKPRNLAKSVTVD